MAKLSTYFLIGFVITGVLGFLDVGSPTLSGLNRAMAGTFFILFFIFRLLGGGDDADQAHT